MILKLCFILFKTLQECTVCYIIQFINCQFNRIIAMEQLDSHIFHAITKLGNNKRQSYENSIYNYNLKTVESLTTEQLDDQLRDLIKANKLENKPHSGRNS